MNPIQSQSGERSVRTIRIDDQKLEKILDTLDANGTKADGKRKSSRYAYRLKAVRVHMQSPGSTVIVPYLVPTRNLSEGGLSFLHGGFVHPGTRCMVQLITTYGTWDDVLGTVVSCRYAESMIHEVSVRFDRQIDPSAYCSTGMHTLVLLVENSASTARLTKFLLKAFNAEVEIAETGSAAIEKAMKTAYDVILMDIELPDMDGCEVTRQLRQRGYSGLIVATSALTRKEDADRCIAAGCDKHVAKPLSKETLWEILSSLSEEPSVSAFDNDPAMADMIDAYVQELPTKVRAVEEAMSMQDAKRVESITRALKAEGTSFGFGAISELAAKIENTLIDGAALANVQREIKTLVRLCLHARSSAKSRPPANASGVGESTERRTPPSAPTPH